jgi:hypothetical protein
MQRWRRTIRTAQAHEQPFEEARAHFEIGRHLPAADAERRVHLERAQALAQSLGYAYELDRIRDALSEPPGRK